MSHRTMRVIPMLALCIWACLPGSSKTASPGSSIVLNIEDVQTTSFDGWATSLAWWSNAFGNSPQAELLANAFFTTGTTYFQQELPGLGMNIVRYNIGASIRRDDPGTS